MALTDKLVAIGDQVRRIYKTEDPMTLDQMAQNLSNVVTASDLPSAEEDGAFGRATATEEYGISFDASKLKKYSTSGYKTNEAKYRAKETFSLLGVRVYAKYPEEGIYINVSINGEQKGTFSKNYGDITKNDWNVFYFDTPFAIAVGDEIRIWQANTTYPEYVATGDAAFNGKIEFVTGFNTGFGVTVGGVYDIIFATVQAELPDTYKVERTTMDDIAEEVQRITGTETKISTAQIITALGSVESGSGIPANAKLYYVGNAESISTSFLVFDSESSAVGTLQEG